MNVGIYFTANKNDGGVFQYAVSFLDALAHITAHRYTIINTSADLPERYRHHKQFTVVDQAAISRQASQAHFLQLKLKISAFLGAYFPNLLKHVYQLHLFWLVRAAIWFTQRRNIQAIDALGLDCVIFPAAADVSYFVQTHTIVAIHDVAHRLHPEFPEVSEGGRWEYRDSANQQICRKAVKILVDSPASQEDIERFYHPAADKIVVLPYLASASLPTHLTATQVQTVLQTHHIQQPYAYYPAKFWPHKNHLRLLTALHLLRRQGIKLNVVFTGATAGEFSTYPFVLRKIKQLGLQNQVFILGYVDDLTVAALYTGAIALVMPTFFGPTNIPVVEAWRLGTPVITSNLPGNSEQIAPAALLVDPAKPKELEGALAAIVTQPNLGQQLILAGKEKMAAWQEKDFVHAVEHILSDVDLQHQ